MLLKGSVVRFWFLHYCSIEPLVLPCANKDPGDQGEDFIDFEKGIDWTFGVTGHEDKRQTAEGPTQV